MKVIDADYLNNVLERWKNEFDKNSIEHKMITEFIHCLHAQDMVIDIQSTINEIYDEKHIYSLLNKEDVQSAVIYNDGLNNAIDVLKRNINPNNRNSFVWDNQNELQNNIQESEIELE